MEIKKDDIILVCDARKRVFKAVALGNFNTEIDEYYPIAELEHNICLYDIGGRIPCSHRYFDVIRKF